MNDTERRADLLETVTLYREKYVTTDKFSDADVESEPELIDLALEYLTVYDGTFEFITDLKEKSKGSISAKQARGVLNTMLAERRRQEHPVDDTPINGLANNGHYLMPGHPELEVRAWRDDGTRMLRVMNTKTNHWDAFASINPNDTYRMWGKFNTDYLRDLATEFLYNGTTKDREDWAVNWANMTGKCFLCGINPQPDHNIGLCEQCGTGEWATSTIANNSLTAAEIIKKHGTVNLGGGLWASTPEGYEKHHKEQIPNE